MVKCPHYGEERTPVDGKREFKACYDKRAKISMENLKKSG